MIKGKLKGESERSEIKDKRGRGRATKQMLCTLLEAESRKDLQHIVDELEVLDKINM